jgi:elongator complex protein 3
MKIEKITIKELIKKRVKSPEGLAKTKREIAKKFKIPCLSNVQLIKAYHKLLEEKRIKRQEKLEKILRKRPIRTLSGVAVVSVLTKPYPCPGKCIFCPTEKGLPKSYLKGEPAAERALKLNFDPYLQVKKRIESLKKQGHPTDKLELRVIGANFSSYPKNYKIWFFANLFTAANGRKKLKKFANKELKKEQKINEKAKNRIVGASVETRPDFINKNEILLMRNLGITMVELGVQSVIEDILKKSQRGHGIKEIIFATRLLKDAGFKIMYQIMPNLPGSDTKKDLLVFKEIFNNENYKPDWLKIYPCLVCKGSKLHEIWKKGNFKPYSDKELIELLIKIKSVLPCWVRLARLFRDIPAPKIEAGSKVSNLRELIQSEMEKRNLKCNCIRCREIKKGFDPKEKVFLFRQSYPASKGKEIFLSFENKKRTKLLAFLRLRITRNNFITALNNSAIVRELHTYGQQIPLKEKSLSAQHQGLGKKLIKEAEKITKEEFELLKIAVISGIGAREYYKKLGYELENEYMVKSL